MLPLIVVLYNLTLIIMKIFIKLAHMVNTLPKEWKDSKKIILKCAINQHLNTIV